MISRAGPIRGIHQNISMFPQPVVPPWKRRLAVLFALADLGALAYGLLVPVRPTLGNPCAADEWRSAE